MGAENDPLTDIRDRVKEICSDLKDTKNRLRELETKQATAEGVAKQRKDTQTNFQWFVGVVLAVLGLVLANLQGWI
jgi:hypothetical protein